MNFLVNSKKLLILIAASFLILLTVELIYMNEKILLNANLDAQMLILTRTNNKIDKLNEYKEHHELIMKQSIQRNQSLKIVFNVPAQGGYGQKVYSFLTSLLIAILTDSALLVNWKHIDKFIDEPMYQTFNRFDHVMNEFNVEFNTQDIYFFKIIKSKHMNESINTVIPFNYTRMFYDSVDSRYFFEICSNPIYYDKFLSYDLVRNETISQAMIKLNDPFSNDDIKLNKLFKIGFEVGRNLLNKFWLPKQTIQNVLDYYLETKFGSNYVIGIQIGSNSMANNDDLLVNCALELEKKEVNKMMVVKWFISSDSPIILERLLNQYGQDKIIIANGTVGRIDLDSNSYERTILDNELLSKCNQLIVTSSKSSFGFIAAMRMQKMPYIIDKTTINGCSRMNLSLLNK